VIQKDCCKEFIAQHKQFAEHAANPRINDGNATTQLDGDLVDHHLIKQRTLTPHPTLRA